MNIVPSRTCWPSDTSGWNARFSKLASEMRSDSNGTQERWRSEPQKKGNTTSSINTAKKKGKEKGRDRKWKWRRNKVNKLREGLTGGRKEGGDALKTPSLKTVTAGWISAHAAFAHRAFDWKSHHSNAPTTQYPTPTATTRSVNESPGKIIKKIRREKRGRRRTTHLRRTRRGPDHRPSPTMQAAQQDPARRLCSTFQPRQTPLRPCCSPVARQPIPAQRCPLHLLSSTPEA